MYVKIISLGFLLVVSHMAIAQVVIPAIPPKSRMTEQDIKDLENKKLEMMKQKYNIRNVQNNGGQKQ